MLRHCLLLGGCLMTGMERESQDNAIPAPLRVELRVATQQLCAEEPDSPVVSMWLSLEATFTNSGTGNLIVAKGRYVVAGRVASVLRDGSAGGLLFGYHLTYDYGSLEAVDYGARPDSDRFAILSPGGKHSEIVTTTLAVSHAEARAEDGLLAPNARYMLQLDIQMSPPTAREELLSELARRWSAYGELVGGVTSSTYVAIDVPALGHVRRCPGSPS